MSRPKQRPLAKIRHDLRTPINHIIGFSEILLEETPGRVPESFSRDLQKIRSGGDQLLALINQHLREETFPVEKPDLHQLCHELRTPVNHIIGYSELLMEQSAELGLAACQPDLAKINSAARTWLSLMEEHMLGETGPPRTDHNETEMFRRMEQELAVPVPEEKRHPTTEQGRLLLADDDAPNRELLCRRLEKLGYEVTACANGIEALELARGGKFELVLLDLLMPGMDGREVLARMKEDPTLK